MFSSFKAFLLVSTLIVKVCAAGAIVNTPAKLVECQPISLTWSGGVAPYFLSIIPGGQAGAAALLNFGEVNSLAYTWNVNLTSGTSVSIAVTDSTGVVNYSSPLTINSGISTDCIGGRVISSVTSTSDTSSSATTSATANTTPITVVPSTSVATSSTVASSAVPVVIASSAAPVVLSPTAVASATTTASGTAAAVTPKSTSGSSTLTISGILVAAAFALMV